MPSKLIGLLIKKSITSNLTYSISQEICTRFLLCCALLWLYIDWFSHIHQAYFTATRGEGGGGSYRKVRSCMLVKGLPCGQTGGWDLGAIDDTKIDTRQIPACFRFFMARESIISQAPRSIRFYGCMISGGAVDIYESMSLTCTSIWQAIISTSPQDILRHQSCHENSPSSGCHRSH